MLSVKYAEVKDHETTETSGLKVNNMHTYIMHAVTSLQCHNTNKTYM